MDYEATDRWACQRARFELEAKAYARRCRNKDKRRYAELYAAWRVRSDAPFDFDGGPEDPAHGLALSYLARQAVRMELDGRFQAARP